MRLGDELPCLVVVAAHAEVRFETGHGPITQPGRSRLRDRIEVTLSAVTIVVRPVAVQLVRVAGAQVEHEAPVLEFGQCARSQRIALCREADEVGEVVLAVVAELQARIDIDRMIAGRARLDRQVLAAALRGLMAGLVLHVGRSQCAVGAAGAEVELVAAIVDQAIGAATLGVRADKARLYRYRRRRGEQRKVEAVARVLLRQHLPRCDADGRIQVRKKHSAGVGLVAQQRGPRGEVVERAARPCRAGVAGETFAVKYRAAAEIQRHQVRVIDVAVRHDEYLIAKARLRLARTCRRPRLVGGLLVLHILQRDVAIDAGQLEGLDFLGAAAVSDQEQSSNPDGNR